MYQNLKKARRRWGVIARVLENTVAMVRYHGMMYMAVAQSVLLYVSESWVVVGTMLKSLEGFHHWAARQITGITETGGLGGDW